MLQLIDVALYISEGAKKGEKVELHVGKSSQKTCDLAYSMQI